MDYYLSNYLGFMRKVYGLLSIQLSIYLGFMRKVYGLLSIQLSITTLIGAALILTPGVKEMVQVRNPFFT